MSRADFVIVGAGGFGRETIDTYLAARAVGTTSLNLLGVIDDSPSPIAEDLLTRMGVAHLGTAEEFFERVREVQAIIAIGDPAARAGIARRWRGRMTPAEPLVHPTAVVGTLTRLGRGSVVCAGAIVSTNVLLGVSVHLNPGTVIGHDAVLDDFVSVNPGAVVSGAVRVRRESLVGAGSCVLQGLTVGANATVGASACVTKDVEPGRTVKGVPAR
ncbi:MULTISPECIES: NeuD/PglB/VioB family sugar acetyltransferase [Bacteria]|uniref:NeuD/PglB/VioB family sugar acetyltransferase n=1 Tax=Bacteria TaxID=2 RepID=UPI003C79CB8D